MLKLGLQTAGVAVLLHHKCKVAGPKREREWFVMKSHQKKTQLDTDNKELNVSQRNLCAETLEFHFSVHQRRSKYVKPIQWLQNNGHHRDCPLHQTAQQYNNHPNMHQVRLLQKERQRKPFMKFFQCQKLHLWVKLKKNCTLAYSWGNVRLPKTKMSLFAEPVHSHIISWKSSNLEKNISTCWVTLKKI